MSVEATIYSALTGSAVATYVSTRIYPLNLPQDCVMPAIVFFKIAEQIPHAMGVDTDEHICQMQVSIWGNKYEANTADGYSASYVANEVKKVLNRYKGGSGTDGIISDMLIDNESTYYEPDTKRYHVVLEYTVFYK